MKELFVDLVRSATGALRGSQVLLANFAGERSDFVRFNRGLVRQPMTVTQAQLELVLIEGRRRNRVVLTLSTQAAPDRERVADAVRALSAELATLPEDPYLLYATEPASSERVDAGTLPDARQAIEDVVEAARGTDLVGILGSGPVQRGFANSLGALHWHAVDAFLFDWSLYHSADKAVKCAWAGSRWDGAELRRRIDAARADLAHLARPARTLEPGAYRAYLAPAAIEELMGMINWSGVSAKAQRTKQSSLQRLVEGEATLSPLVNLSEDAAGGLAPAFDEAGFTKPARVTLVRDGVHAGSMVSPRTAAEYGIPANGADAGEGTASLLMAGGSLPERDALSALDTGLAIGNLNYLNFSDRPNGRITGLTRFATFWVEHGRIVAPVNVMRWDDTLYRLLGTQLEALTDAPQWRLSADTYERRALESMRVPGALLAGMTFTL
jgi:predicted Zn-dependent protease